jgi:predicted nucleic-acid-binding protein
MIAIDTNILLRYLLNDDKTQSKKAANLITGSTPVLITDVVLAETIWTLKGKKYNLRKYDIVQIITALFEEQNIIFEDGQTIWRALNDYRKAEPVKVGRKRKEADFQDALIVNKAKYKAQEDKVILAGVYTFDVAAQAIPGTTAP